MCKTIYQNEHYEIDNYTQIQTEFIQRIENYGTESALEWLLTAKNGIERTHPQTVRFEWINKTGEKSLFELSESEDFINPIKIETYTNHCEVDNLKNGIKYFWRINNGEVSSFSTKKHFTRFINVDGLFNVRDIGGDKIQQGLVYRGSELDCNYHITNKGKEIFCNELKIKTDLDLRFEPHEHTNVCPAGESVTLKKIKYRPYLEIFEDQYKKNICEIMALFANEKNYPVYIHCMGGADRTGMIALFLRALVGEEDNTIHLDYEMTGLSTYAAGHSEGADGFRSRNSSYYKEFLNELNSYAPNEPLKIQVRKFLIECGVSHECMNKIVNILMVKK